MVSLIPEDIYIYIPYLISIIDIDLTRLFVSVHVARTPVKG